MSVAARAHQARHRLSELLTIAALIEHAVACQYLFAAHSMKCLPHEGCTPQQFDLLRRWKGTLLSIARMEMEHLALVNNVLNAIGESSVLGRPAFPTGIGHFPVMEGFSLERFGLDAVGRFVLVEAPDHRTRGEMAFVRFLRAAKPGSPEHKLYVQFQGRSAQANSIAQLYDEIEEVLRAMTGAVEKQLFVGDPQLQLSGDTIDAASRRARQSDVKLTEVTDARSASKVIRRIRAEGEGSRPHAKFVALEHFPRFVDMYMELSKALCCDDSFEPARAVVANPVLRRNRNVPQQTKVTNVTARSGMEAYDLAYDTCLRLLSLLFSTPTSASDYAAIQGAAFFPLMTMVLRPLGDLLTQLPAGDGHLRAGPSFLAASSLGSAVPSAGLSVITGQLVDLSSKCRTLTATARADRTLPRAAATSLRKRFAFVEENTWRIAENFQASLQQ